MQHTLHLRHDGRFPSLSLSLTDRCREKRNYSNHFSSFLDFTWKLLALFCLGLINGTLFLVAVVIKSNEDTTGWGFVDSARGNWGGGCLRWGVCVWKEIEFHFSFSIVNEVCVRGVLVRWTLVYVWMVGLVFGLKGYRAGGVEEKSPLPKSMKGARCVSLKFTAPRGVIIKTL